MHHLGLQIIGQKINKAKFVVALGIHQLTIAHNNQQNLCENDAGGIAQDARPAENAGGTVLDCSGGGRVGRGESIK